jgi:Zn-dependent protease/CBS domain-containing protein
MNPDTAHSPGPNRSAPPGRGLRLGTLFGIEVRLDASLIIIFALIVYMLGGNVFPVWHPDWPGSTTWLTAAAAGILFFASVLAHELAHSLVSRRFGIEVRRITLFLFGGMAEIEEEPRDPKAEFLIAIVGPMTSIAIGLLCTSIGSQLAGAELAELFAEDQKAALAGLSPAATLCLWLGPVNLVLGLFNMVPGFPLDGGRVLRALIWWLTGDQRRATRIASECGRLFGWVLIMWGVLQIVSGTMVQGLWLVLIGWFLSNAASSSYKQLVMRDLLKGVTARDLMRSRFESVSAQLRVGEFIDAHLLQSPQMLWPVLEDGQLIGLLTLQQVKDIPTENRSDMPVGQVMRTDLAALSMSPDTDANQTLLALATHNSPLAVVENNRVLGLISQLDAMKWLQLHHL